MPGGSLWEYWRRRWLFAFGAAAYEFRPCRRCGTSVSSARLMCGHTYCRSAARPIIAARGTAPIAIDALRLTWKVGRTRSLSWWHLWHGAMELVQAPAFSECQNWTADLTFRMSPTGLGSLRASGRFFKTTIGRGETGHRADSVDTVSYFAGVGKFVRFIANRGHQG